MFFAFCHVITPSRLFSSHGLRYEKAVVLHPAALHLPSHRVDNDPEVTAEQDPTKVAQDQVELVGPNIGITAIERLGHVRDKDEHVEGETEAVPDEPEDEEDPRGGPDAVDEQAGGGHAHDRETHSCAPRDCAHHWRCVSLHLIIKNVRFCFPQKI